VVADAGMVSHANRMAIEAEGLSFILGMKIPDIPWVVADWAKHNPGAEVADGQVFTQPWPAGTRADEIRSSTTSTKLTGASDAAWHRRASKQSREGRRGEDPGQTQPVHHHHRRAQVDQPRTGSQSPRAGRPEGYITNIDNPSAEFVIGAYHQLWHIEKSFHMSKHDLRARPTLHPGEERVDRGQPLVARQRGVVPAGAQAKQGTR